MERIGRPGDDFRARLRRDDIETICVRHRLAKPVRVCPEYRGNEKVCYHLDDKLFLAFCVNDDPHQVVETLRVFERLNGPPVPKVVGWCENDPVLNVPYVILTRLPGKPFDIFWNELDHASRVRLLEAFGAATGHYHTCKADEARHVARKLDLEARVANLGCMPSRLDRDFAAIGDAIGTLADALPALGYTRTSIISPLECLCARDLAGLPDRFSPSGLTHEEPCAEHYFFEGTGGMFRLSGCVDLECVAFADIYGELVFRYAETLSVHTQYWQAFKRGFERFFSFPPGAESLLRLGAVAHDANGLIHLVRDFREWHGMLPAWRKSWIEGHVYRLECWLHEKRYPERALFRRDIGPW